MNFYTHEGVFETHEGKNVFKKEKMKKQNIDMICLVSLPFSMIHIEKWNASPEVCLHHRSRLSERTL